MMLRLARPWFFAIAGRRAWLCVPIGALLAALLALDPVLGAEDGLGAYLAYVALLPAAIVLRVGAVADARRRDGFELEETLRDPRGRRAALGAVLGAWLALALGLLACALPPLLRPAPSRAQEAAHPLTWSAAAGGGLRGDARGAVPDGSTLLLTLSWERAPAAGEAPALIAPDGRTVPIEPGTLARWPLTRAECRAGVAEWGMNSDARAAGVATIRPLSRLMVPMPAPASLPLLLAGQFLFAAPLCALTLLLARRARVGGLLAALSALALGGLLAFDPREPPLLPAGPLGWLGRAGLGLKDALPDLRGLAASGHGFELRAGTTSAAAILVWCAIGVTAGLLARSARRPA